MRLIIALLVRVKRFVFSIVNRVKYRHLIDHGHYKYVHLMFNDKFNKPFVDFLNRHFDSKEHLILCKRIKHLKHPFPEGANVVEVKSYCGFNYRNINVKKLICHSLFDNEIIDVLYHNKEILQNKAWWMIWGGDLYNATRSLKDDFVRANMAGWITDTDGDDVVAAGIYGNKPKIIRAGYTFPITLDMVASARRKKKQTNHYVCVQINNSCDCSTLEILDVLSRYRDHGIVITTILSYGELKWRDAIIRKGKQLFGENFKPVMDYFPPEEYAKRMVGVDVLILNQNRQQGIGNCFLALALGAKLFIRSSVTTYAHFKSRGIICYDTLSICNLSFDEFTSREPNERDVNGRLVETFFNGDDIALLWYKVFAEN